MLLTSSQVSVLLACAMILLCTSALFISGCLIQQRTLRDLRTAIRPAVVTRPKPKVWDTEALKRRRSGSSMIKLEDGTRVQIHQSNNPYDDKSDPDIIEIRPTIEDTKGVEEEKKKQEDWDGVQEGGEPLSRAERRRRIKAEIQRLSRGDTPVYYQRRLW
ncbi:hypothetical protein GGS20DRAFT_539631 [Poronia punctata]|nr:hypothetical protein GGS20DRAFT_539631 [Poronia punctata]